MEKLKIVWSQLFYPVSIGRYILEAFQEREDCEIRTIGPAFGNWIPWGGGMTLPSRYVLNPDIYLPRTVTQCSIGLAEAQLKDFAPDVWIQVDAGFHFVGKPKHGLNVLVETDPHALPDWYNQVRKYHDLVWCMQTPYLNSGETFLPYAYSSKWFYPENREKIYDACLIGIPYTQRHLLIDRLKKEGLRIYFGHGAAYEEYRQIYNQSRVALSWSSLYDTPMRVYEAFGMCIPLVANRTADLMNQFTDGVDFRGFDTVEEGVEQVKWCLENPDGVLDMVSRAGQKAFEGYTWKVRAGQMIEEIKRRL